MREGCGDKGDTHCYSEPGFVGRPHHPPPSSFLDLALSREADMNLGLNPLCTMNNSVIPDRGERQKQAFMRDVMSDRLRKEKTKDRDEIYQNFLPAKPFIFE